MNGKIDGLYYYLLYGKLRKRAVCGKFCVLIGYPSRQDEQYCPPRTSRFVPANKILPKFKQVHESFLSLKLLSAKVKRFVVISPSLWNQKTGKPKASMRMKTKKTKMLMCLKNMFCNKQVRQPFFSVLFMPYNISIIDQASSVKMAGYWPSSLFAILWTATLANIQPSWPRAWSIIYVYCWVQRCLKIFNISWVSN